MPKALYRLARDERHQNPSPVLIGDGKAMLSTRQASDYFLCPVCEDLFSKHGESWVLNHCWRDDKTFRLRDLLVKTPPYPGSSEDTKLYLMDVMPGVDADKIIYFAASVFWRGAARSWTIGDHGYAKLKFERYEEQFRKYLLGQAAFPTRAAMLIFVGSSMAEIENNIIAFPNKISTNGSHIFRFRIPGMTFIMILGARSEHYMHSCSVHVKGRPIYIMKGNDQWNFKTFMEEYAGSKRVGKLKERTEGPAAAPPRWSAEEIRSLLPPPRKQH